jgi:eukaryotic-like serine/threonine-protein kinase
VNDNPAVAPARDGRAEGIDAGARLAQFRIIELMAVGGTGRVYRADDTRLQRPVALKVISPSLTRDAATRARFFQQAHAAADLAHPSIATILSIGEIPDGRVFIAMALYEGATLERRIREGPVPEDEALAIAHQAASGLAHAHEQGIVHCDVKPANLFLTREGTVKLLDFGLAKLSSHRDPIEPGRVAGTIHYMSPEQISGRGVDRRTDVWSLGVVLYEMLAGRRPFQAARRGDVLDAILHDDPLPISAARPDVRAETSRLVEKALLRRPAGRVTMQELTARLGDLVHAPASVRAVAPAGSAREPSVLVLAFASLKPCAEDELFARGLTEALIADLSRVAGLRVVSRTAGAGVRASSARIRAACRDMNVEFVLEGSVQRDADGVFSISARLVEVQTDFLAWSARADARNILKTRAALTGGIAAASLGPRRGPSAPRLD